MTGFHQDKAWSRDKVPLLISHDSSCLFYQTQSVGTCRGVHRTPCWHQEQQDFRTGFYWSQACEQRSLMQSRLIWQPCSVYGGVSVYLFLTKYMFLCTYICEYRVCSSLWMTAQALVISNQEHEGIRVPFTTPALPCYFSLPFIHPSTHPSNHHKHSITLLLPLSFIHSIELRLLGRLCLPVRLSGMIG